MAVVVGVGDIPEHPLYSNTFHILDICKDATEAAIPITKEPSSLYGATIKTLFRAKDDVIRCSNYKKKLLAIEKGVTIDGIVKPINRLTSPLNVLDTGIPLSIRKCIRDSGASASSFNESITILYNPSDYTDPSSRTAVPVDAEKFPLPGTPFHIGEDVFNRIVRQDSPVKSFTAVMNDDDTCTIQFNLFFAAREYVFTSTISSDFTEGDGNAREFFTTTGDPPEPSGNPKKNTFFSKMNSSYRALIANRNFEASRNLLARGIGYIVSKEYFGDILIAMVALKYKQQGSGDAAIFTSDNALTAICKMWKINVVSKNWNRSSSTEESVAIMYDEDPAQELINNKEQIKDSVLRWNTNIRNRLLAVDINKEIKHLGRVTQQQKEFIDSIIAYIERINEGVSVIPTDLGEDLPTFRKALVQYQIKNMIHSIEGNMITFVRGIKYMFRTIPDSIIGKIDIPGEFLETLQRMRSNSRPPFRTYGVIRRGGGKIQRAGGKIQRIAKKQKGGNLEDDIDIDPTGVLKSIISRNIDPQGEETAVDDIYNFLYMIYNIECKICYDEDVIRNLISGYLGEMQALSYEDLISTYNNMLRIDDVVETNVEYNLVERGSKLFSIKKPVSSFAPSNSRWRTPSKYATLFRKTRKNKK